MVTAIDTFVRANQSSWGLASDGVNTWVKTGSGTATIVSNEGLLVSTTSDTVMQLGTNTSGDCNILCRVAIGNSGDIVGVTGRLTNPSTQNLYKLLWYSGNLHINKAVAGTNTVLTTVAFAVTVGSFYYMRLQVVGSTINGKMWASGSSEPTSWTTTTTDTAVTGVGGYGVIGNTASGSTGVQYDHFTATDNSGVISVAPTTLTFSGTAGGSNPANQTVTLTNVGGGSGLWNSTNSSSWLTFTPGTDSLAASATETVTMSVSLTGLAAGTYNDTLTFSMNGTSSSVAVTLTVAATASALSATPAAMSYSAAQNGTAPSPQTITLTNTGGTSDTYTSSIAYGSGSGWLFLSPATGTLAGGASQAVSLSASPNGLVVGTYTATVTYTLATGPTATTSVTLSIVPDTSPSPSGSATNTVATVPYAVQINNTPVFVEAGTLLIDSTIGKRSTASFTVHDVTGRTHYQQYQQVSIYDQNNALAFSGYVDKPEEQKPGFQSTLNHTITCIDQHYLADKRIVAASYVNKTTGFIAQDILNTILSQEGVTVGMIYDGIVPNTTLYPSSKLYPGGNVGPIPSATFVYCTAAAALDELVKEASAAGVPYYWQIDQFKKLYFCPYTAITNNTVIDGTKIDLVNTPPKVSRHNPSYRNTQYVVGGVAQTAAQTKTIIGDGHTSSWPMDYAISSITSVTLNGTAQPVGIKGSTGSNYYFTQGDPILAQDTKATKLATTDTLIVTYVGEYPNVTTTQNGGQVAYLASLDATSGIVEAVENNTTITSADNGLSVASQLLTRYGVQGTMLECTTLASGYQQGQLIPVNLASFGLNNVQMLIEEVSASDQTDGINIWYTIKAVQGPYDTTWQDFFSSLLKQQQSASTINAGVSQTLTLFHQYNATIAPTIALTANFYSCPLPSSALYPAIDLYPC